MITEKQSEINNKKLLEYCNTKNNNKEISSFSIKNTTDFIGLLPAENGNYVLPFVVRGAGDYPRIQIKSNKIKTSVRLNDESIPDDLTNDYYHYAADRMLIEHEQLMEKNYFYGQGQKGIHDFFTIENDFFGLNRNDYDQLIPKKYMNNKKTITPEFVIDILREFNFKGKYDLYLSRKLFCQYKSIDGFLDNDLNFKPLIMTIGGVSPECSIVDQVSSSLTCSVSAYANPFVKDEFCYLIKRGSFSRVGYESKFSISEDGCELLLESDCHMISTNMDKNCIIINSNNY